MAIFESYAWWYTTGWRVFMNKVRAVIGSVTDFFSMGSLLRTLFKPFRQISADSANENSSLDLKFHMFIDRLVSRIVGFSSRLILLLTGCIIIIIGSVISLLIMIIWPVVPVLPIAGIILSICGVII